MPFRGRVAIEGIRFAAGVASKPSDVVTLWKAATGGKTVGCLPSTPVPELPHAAGLLPIALESREDRSLFSGQMNAWLVAADLPFFSALPVSIPRFAFPRVPPVGLEEALERIEALAEWVEAVSGSPASEGGLWKSIRAYAIRRSLLDALDERITRESAFLTPEEHRDIVRAGIFLPPEAHSRLLSSILGDPEPGPILTEGEKGDPLIVLAKRSM
ncbi:MAG: hypothetical protein IH610_14660 [Deltaproteobacteria bacterium]|nr:hypothetical protein [Deltaproteobacteria bacterium]